MPSRPADPSLVGPEPVLEFDRVTLHADGGRVLLDGVSLTVWRGRVTVIVGPSGSGKSTLLRVGNRLEVPEEGTVRLDGDDLGDLDVRRVRRRVGMIFQEPVCFPGSVADNLRVGSPDASESELRDVLERVGLDTAMMERVADELSGGEAQRMCIARALLTDPEVLLMDEPTSALDPERRTTIERLARGFAGRGLAVVWVTHDLDQARRLGDEVRVLLSGRIVDGPEADEFLDGRGTP